MFNIWVFGYESYENKGGWGCITRQATRELLLLSSSQF